LRFGSSSDALCISFFTFTFLRVFALLQSFCSKNSIARHRSPAFLGLRSVFLVGLVDLFQGDASCDNDGRCSWQVNRKSENDRSIVSSSIAATAATARRSATEVWLARSQSDNDVDEDNHKSETIV
jgi:hypothetical protein